MQKPESVRFGSFMCATFVGHALGMAAFVGLAGRIMGMPARSLLVPYMALLCCGLLFSPSLYWVRRARAATKSRAIRFAVAMLLYTAALIVALGFGTIKLHILSRTEAVSDFALLVLVLAAFNFTVAYRMMRRRGKTPESG